jgi:hypothetical protein
LAGGWQQAEWLLRKKGMNNVNPNSEKGNILPGDRILTIAQVDALAACSDLSPYRIRLALEDDGWHVDYELKDPKLKGGGPHYVIHAVTGAIISKRYEQ